MEPELIKKRLQAYPGWMAAFPTQQLIRIYTFPSFQEAVELVNFVARQLRDQHRLIEVAIRGTTVTLALSSFADGLVSTAEFELAGAIDEFLEREQAAEIERFAAA